MFWYVDLIIGLQVSALEEDLEMEEDEDASSDEETTQQPTNAIIQVSQGIITSQLINTLFFNVQVNFNNAKRNYYT